MRMTSRIWRTIYPAGTNIQSANVIHRERNLHLIERKIEENISSENIHLTLEKEKKERKKKIKLMQKRIMIMREIKETLQERLEKEKKQMTAMQKLVWIHRIETPTGITWKYTYNRVIERPSLVTIQDETTDDEEGKKTTTLTIYETSV
ncbi:uncharacterized protein LOC143769873 isoform X2 [Ranitomeya variabilis]|uniref:uncharacterized protein LOC143769873 isoform X2 n=1 Tax=Ranitomeya variabilis TaxID=490064 RepID=UPI004055E482